ncbi:MULTISPECIES: 2-phospho-L-lactate guanylyltransferase [unclassified Nocardioides]|uniref:2-phospho-L-lactate guanylyltransferase n=1 Tax=unclassified Nocardioides TaxID=2615069 RepID=UPI000A26CB38|nr:MULTISPECIES: 2-phospho-L-lactate guanylyltransferase [unclassified Nocardioides]
MSDQQYAVLVPVKPPARAKSRLGDVGDEARRSLAEAFAQDTVAACLAAPSVAVVLVVTDDVRFSTVLTALGCEAVPDGVTGDLNGTLRQAAAEAHRRWPHLVPVALCADLPALVAGDLEATLARVSGPHPWFVPDADGVGTTLYAAAYAEFDPRFGPGSRDAHLDAGARELADVAASVRRDVDDLDDLREAVALGVGPRTAAAVPTTT